MKVTAKVILQPHLATGRPLTVTIPAGGAAPVAWNLTAPEGISNLKWHVTARSEDGKTDQITVDQQVVPAVPTSVWAATLTRVSRSEEHTSELQSLMRISYAVFCLKKKK